MIVDTALREREASRESHPRRDGRSRRHGPRHRPAAGNAGAGNPPRGDREPDGGAWGTGIPGGRRHGVESRRVRSRGGSGNRPGTPGADGRSVGADRLRRHRCDRGSDGHRRGRGACGARGVRSRQARGPGERRTRFAARPDPEGEGRSAPEWWSPTRTETNREWR